MLSIFLACVYMCIYAWGWVHGDALWQVDRRVCELRCVVVALTDGTCAPLCVRVSSNLMTSGMRDAGGVRMAVKCGVLVALRVPTGSTMALAVQCDWVKMYNVCVRIICSMQTGRNVRLKYLARDSIMDVRGGGVADILIQRRSGACVRFACRAFSSSRSTCGKHRAEDG